MPLGESLDGFEPEAEDLPISTTPQWGSISGDLQAAEAWRAAGVKEEAEAKLPAAGPADDGDATLQAARGSADPATTDKEHTGKSKRRRKKKPHGAAADANGSTAKGTNGAASAAAVPGEEGAEGDMGADDEEPKLFIPRTSSLLDAFPAGPPASAQEQLQHLFAHLYMRSVTDFASMRLYALRDGVMGVERIRALIEGGSSPENIAVKIASQEELRRIFETAVVKQVKDQALGYAAEVFASLLRAVSIQPCPRCLKRFQADRSLLIRRNILLKKTSNLVCSTCGPSSSHNQIQKSLLSPAILSTTMS